MMFLPGLFALGGLGIDWTSPTSFGDSFDGTLPEVHDAA